MSEFNFDTGLDEQDEFVTRSRKFTVGDLLRKEARMHADRLAVSEPATGIERTYSELNERVNGLANALLERGIEPEESTIALLSENRAESVDVFHAGAKLGCLVASQNWRLEREELTHCVDIVDPDVLFVSKRFGDKREWIEEDLDVDPLVVAFGEQGDTVAHEDLVSEGPTAEPLPDREIDPEQGFCVLYTSGTTGLPKGAVVSHRAQLNRAMQVFMEYKMEKGDGYPGWGPMFHEAGASWVVATAFTGGTYYPIDGFDEDQILQVCQEAERAIGWLFLVPGVVGRIIDAAAEKGLGPEDFQTVHCVGCLADLVDPDKIAEVTELFDAPYGNTFGATEYGHAASGNVIPVGERPTKERLPKTESPYVDVKLIDQDWNEVEERGELAVRGPPLCSGYVDNPEANQADFRDGWFRTGDILVREDDGRLSFVNRRKYLIKSGGENIYPGEIESILIEHPDVSEAVAVRVEHDEWGEVPRVVVGVEDPRPGLRDELMDELGDQLANYKLPRYLEMVDPTEFPRSSSGKIQRGEVEEWNVDESTQVRDT